MERRGRRVMGVVEPPRKGRKKKGGDAIIVVIYKSDSTF